VIATFSLATISIAIKTEFGPLRARAAMNQWVTPAVKAGDPGRASAGPDCHLQFNSLKPAII